MPKERKNKIDTKNIAGKKYFRTEEACALFSLGKGPMRALAKDAKAMRKIGNTLLINSEKCENYIEENYSE